MGLLASKVKPRLVGEPSAFCWQRPAVFDWIFFYCFKRYFERTGTKSDKTAQQRWGNEIERARNALWRRNCAQVRLHAGSERDEENNLLYLKCDVGLRCIFTSTRAVDNGNVPRSVLGLIVEPHAVNVEGYSWPVAPVLFVPWQEVINTRQKDRTLEISLREALRGGGINFFTKGGGDVRCHKRSRKTTSYASRNESFQNLRNTLWSRRLQQESMTYRLELICASHNEERYSFITVASIAWDITVLIL